MVTVCHEHLLDGMNPHDCHHTAARFGRPPLHVMLSANSNGVWTPPIVLGFIYNPTPSYKTLCVHPKM